MLFASLNLFFCFLAVIRTFAIGQVPFLIEKSQSTPTKPFFPKHFSFGAATAAYQIEGGWNDDGKGPSIWDTLTHNHPDLIADHMNADVGPDSFHFYEKDIEALKVVGLQHYRFSISWSRIFPNGLEVNRNGFKYYRNLIDKLIINHIEPIVTLHHYDVPQWIEDEGGFLNENIVEFFKMYADEVFQELGSVVKIWITFNEPMDVCVEGYDSGVSAPLVHQPGTGGYLCSYNLLLSHAKVYHLYKEKYSQDQRGILGITLDGRFYYPKSSEVENSVVDRALEFDIGWFAHPIYSQDGGYPQVMIDEIGERSKREGRNSSRLPSISDEIRNFIRGSADFLGYNYYTSRYVEFNFTDYNPKVNSDYYADSRLIFSVDKSWKQAKSTWLYSVPSGLHGALTWFRDQYGNIPVIITENGWSDDGKLVDDERIEYLKAHLESISQAISEGCNVLGYTIWSIIDNFEWMRGFTEHFGLFSVNLTSTTKERIAKKSAKFLKNLISDHHRNHSKKYPEFF